MSSSLLYITRCASNDLGGPKEVGPRPLEKHVHANVTHASETAYRLAVTGFEPIQEKIHKETFLNTHVAWRMALNCATFCPVRP